MSSRTADCHILIFLQMSFLSHDINIIAHSALPELIYSREADVDNNGDDASQKSCRKDQNVSIISGKKIFQTASKHATSIGNSKREQRQKRERMSVTRQEDRTNSSQSKALLIQPVGRRPMGKSRSRYKCYLNGTKSLGSR